MKQLKTLKNILKKINDMKDGLTFPEILHLCRISLGMCQYRVGELIGVTQNKIKNLEIGYFRVMPSDEVFEKLENLWGIDQEVLKEKALEVVTKHKLSKKIKVIPDNNEEMYHMQRAKIER